MVGHAFMGAAHSQAWRTAPHFFDLPLDIEMAVLVGRDAGRVAVEAARTGWAESSTEWSTVVERDDIDVVDICTPGDLHADIAIAALRAGKHVLCEKPLANSVSDAVRMNVAAHEAFETGVVAMCGFSYRRTPALAFARQLIEDGRLGAFRHVRAQYLQDWLSDAETPLTWRTDKSKAGSGALGDIGAHLIDTAQWLLGEKITGVSALLHTFVSERPIGGERVGLGGRSSGGPRGPVTVDDAALFTTRFDGGAIGAFEATRFALGRRNANRIEINGSRGSLAFDFERMNELEFYDDDAPGEQGFRRILVTESQHPFAANWWPPGHGLGYEHLFTHQVVDFVNAIAGGHQPHPSFEDALGVQRVLDAVERSAGNSSKWTPIDGADS
jgi:predicted dehydrogenase